MNVFIYILAIIKFTDDKNDDVRDRELLRRERHNERARDRNLARANPEKRYVFRYWFLIKIVP